VEVAAMEKGVLLRFDVELDPAAATNVSNYSAERWNYQRTPSYGSPHYRLDGTKGQEPMSPSSAYLSLDRRSVFVGLPDMRPVMQMRLGWALRSAGGDTFEDNAYFTPRVLTKFEAEAEGFDSLEVDLTPRPPPERLEVEISAAEGRRLSELMGCVACHSTDGSTLGRTGPSWKGLFGSVRRLAGGGSVVADRNYLRESIQEPAAKVVEGFQGTDTGMPSYQGVLAPEQVESLVLYLETLR
jgi:mono/diheme cytochrome c family protein